MATSGISQKLFLFEEKAEFHRKIREQMDSNTRTGLVNLNTHVLLILWSNSIKPLGT